MSPIDNSRTFLAQFDLVSGVGWGVGGQGRFGKKPNLSVIFIFNPSLNIERADPQNNLIAYQIQLEK